MSNMEGNPGGDPGIRLRFGVEHVPGASRTDGFPLLVYAPRQHGEGVRTEDNGTPVGEIAAASAEEPDRAKLAARFGTTVEHVKQALAYHMMHDDES